MGVPQIYHHSLETRHHIIGALREHLPVCIPLYRRLQFQHFTADSHILASLNPESYKDGHYSGADGPWIAAYVDRSRRPETEVWVFGTWENTADQDDNDASESLVQALITELRQTRPQAGEISPSTAAVLQPAGEGETQPQTNADHVGRNAYEGHMVNPAVVLFGAVHEHTVKIMRKLGVLPKEFVGADFPYRKYVFNLREDRTALSDIPSDLVWGKVDPAHFPLVRSRTQIPRQDRTLLQLPNVAIYPKAHGSAPIAWSFLGPDGSLSSLHVEPEWRGRGLAKTLTAKLLADGNRTYSEHGTEDHWAHSDVAVDNGASEGVCKSLGGKSGFDVYWVRVDINRV